MTALLPGSRRTTGRPTPAFTGTRLDSLTGLRFFAALLVLLHHVSGSYAGIPALETLARFGASGVLFFFVLSGFVLAWSWRPEDRPRDFYWHRLARVWPLHLLLLLPALPIMAALRGAEEPESLARAAFLLQAWWRDPSDYFAGNPVSWSLSCEVFFYLCFPLVIRGVVALPTWALYATVAGSSSS